jgi:hypothetical protein
MNGGWFAIAAPANGPIQLAPSRRLRKPGAPHCIERDAGLQHEGTNQVLSNTEFDVDQTY